MKLIIATIIGLVCIAATIQPFNSNQTIAVSSTSPTVALTSSEAAGETNLLLNLSYSTYQTNTLLSKPWFIKAQNGGTNVFALSSEGHINIGRTNLFPGKDIDISRVHDRGETAKAWINIVKVDSWPSFTKAVEWWANCGTTDGVMELTWLNNTGGSFNHVFVVNEQFALCRFVMETNNVEVMRMQPAIGDTNSAYYFGTAGTISGPAMIVNHNTTNLMVLSGTGGITTGDPGGGAGSWKLGIETTPGGVTNLTVMVGTQKYQIVATPIP